ncbi:retrograde regulation protein 2 [Lithohypha guttulata]|uniref:retrograde regulation protein 2 n=1 Tax=Lithohypha guttulata TaxID=1690604 RepID=UPI002DE0C7EB|nr:retrograde regulation protein 2 [Lithohypha guttulata]
MVENVSDHLYAIVDMGSNGIRFSITDLAAPTTRSLPTIYQSRLGISLYDAQYSRGQQVPIPPDVIDTIISALKDFKRTSLDFDVPQKADHVRILATEATRNAVNSQDFISAIEKALGEPWRVKLLKKEDEGKIGALGVVSSVGGSGGLEGLVMDLGGGSTQLTWVIARPGEPLQTSRIGSTSFPYGAAAMTQLLSELHTDKDRANLHAKMVQQFRDTFDELELSQSLLNKAKQRGLTLYLSGGGFRGWGYLLMSSHRIRPYPIPIINGFSVSVKDFKDTANVSNIAVDSLQSEIGVFRVSKRRAAQVPAVSYLVDALIEAIPVIHEVRFCQGGVREGWLFDGLPNEVRAMDPLEAASGRFATDAESARKLATLIAASLPKDCDVLDRRVPAAIREKHLLSSFANLMYLQQGHSKESAAVNALHVPITGVLASTHGVGHCERALLSLMLCQRWGGAGELPAPHGELRSRVELLLTQQEVWWARYLGVIGWTLGRVYPAAKIKEERVKISTRWAEGLGKKGNMQGVVMDLSVNKDAQGELLLGKDVLRELVEDIEAIGKKKNRVGGRDYGFGVPVRVHCHW